MSRGVIVTRVLVSMLVGLLLGAITTELAYQLLKRENRAPERIELIIPDGTAERVAAGQAAPGIPENMTFVTGDTLVVVNQDSVNHQLGPLWIPPGNSASMELKTAESFAFECSFQPSKYLGVDVNPPVTLGTRLEGIFFAGLPMGGLFAVYSILISPRKKAKPA